MSKVNLFLEFLKGKIEFGTKSERIFEALRELVNMLFAVVVGVGLEKIGEGLNKLPDPFPLIFLAIVYLVIILSWWGWNFGTVYGPAENNSWLFVIDYLLLILYWFLINKFDNLSCILFLLFIMFFLYYLWECLRWRLLKLDIIKKAEKVNRVFLIFFGLLVTIDFAFGLGDQTLWKAANAIILIPLFIYYRFEIVEAYKCQGDSMVNKDNIEELLIEKAKEAVLNARAHLSNYKVGAAIYSETGTIFTGCNIEFENYSNTIHAEESAISAFITGGGKKPLAIAVFTLGNEAIYPCGMCRQSLMELGGKELRVIAAYKDKYEVKTMGELLPDAFRLRK